MARALLPLSILAALGCAFSTALALSPLAPAIMRVSEIRPGMKGYGLTVFRGTEPERFGVEVIDVLHKFRPDQDLILVRTQHPILDRAITVAGMSGSPIYIDGKLIGAYAYGWSFGKEPVAGVTPIENMLAELTRPVDPHIWRALGNSPRLVSSPLTAAATDLSRAPASPLVAAAPPRLAGLPPYLGAERETPFLRLREHAERQGYLQPNAGSPTPAATPLLVSGLGDAALNLLGREFDRFGLMPVQSGAGGGAREPNAAPVGFVNGGSIGVQLVRGDVNATAIGTVTYVAGRRLVAFGHPMFNAGQSGLATCTARVVHVLASQARSFKLAEPIAPLGTLIHDRQSAIVIDRDLVPEMVPVRVRLQGVSGAARSEWNMEVASNRLLTSGLVLGAVVNALEASAADRSDAVLHVHSRVDIAGHGEQDSDDVVYTPTGAADPGGLSHLRLFSVLGATYGNPFEAARVKRIEIDLRVQYERDVVSIVDAELPSDSVDPGSQVPLAVTLRRFDESEHVETVPIDIPRSAAGETLELSVEPGDEVDIEQPKPNSLDDMLRALRAGYSGTSLVVSTKLPNQGLKLRGQLVRSLPGSALDTLQPVTEADRGSLFSIYERKELPLGHAVTGSAKIKLNVRAEPLR